MSGEAEPRRSIRATKGQHTKSFDQIDPSEHPKRRQSKKAKKEEEPEEEIIRCVCGAREQNEDSGEPWIACDNCAAWQHNVCMGMSLFTEDLPKNYYCEICHPQDHEELLAGIRRGEEPWKQRRAEYEAEQEQQKKKKGGRKSKPKRTSDPKEDMAKAQASPTPEVKPEKEKEETTGKKRAGKRKSAADSQEPTIPATKSRKLAENTTAGASEEPSYTPPADLAQSLDDLPTQRSGLAKALNKSLEYAVDSLVKAKGWAPPDGVTVQSKAISLALEVERAVHDAYPVARAAVTHVKTLAHNLKNNLELCSGLLRGSLDPPTLASMDSDQLASAKMQKEKAEQKARSERQSILISNDGPRVRRTHKGEEVVESETFVATEEGPSVIRRPSVREAGSTQPETPTSEATPRGLGPSQQSPSQSNFNIKTVFDNVRTGTGGHARRSSSIVASANGQVVDPDIDRMLDVGGEEDPYSPTEDNDTGVVWRGSLIQPNLRADFKVSLKWVAGGNLAESAIKLPWSELVPTMLMVQGRSKIVDVERYLCGIRYSQVNDVVVTAVTPSSASDMDKFLAVYEYFVLKGNYASLSPGENKAGVLSDCYLIPVAPGTGGHPEFLMNLADNEFPEARTEPAILAVFVSKMDEETVSRVRQAAGKTVRVMDQYLDAQGNELRPPGSASQTPTAAPHAGAPAPSLPPPTPSPTNSSHQMSEEQRRKAQEAGAAVAREVLGDLLNCPTGQFLFPQAFQMTRKEWVVVKQVYQDNPRSMEDVGLLAKLLESRGSQASGGGSGPRPGANSANGQPGNAPAASHPASAPLVAPTPNPPSQ